MSIALVQRTPAAAFTLTAAIGAAGAIVGGVLGEEGRWLHYVCKPLATAALLAMAAFAIAPVSSRYRLAIVVGLTLSLAGDVLLMLPQDRFVAGLVCFLLAHCAYLVAFTDGVRLVARPLIWFICLALAGLIVALLWPGLPGVLRVPVTAYAVVLASMAAQAITWAQVLTADAGSGLARAARLAALGGMLFIVSDTLLAYGRFRGADAGLNPALAPLWVLGSYYAAQWCIARSVDLRGAARPGTAP